MKGVEFFSTQIIETVILLSFLALVPLLAVMTTSFTRLIIVFSFLRNALGLQQTPPNSVLLSLSLILTLLIMGSRLENIYFQAYLPFKEQKIDEKQALELAGEPLRVFMLKQTSSEAIENLAQLAQIDGIESKQKTPWRLLLPAFVLSELKKSFEMGFIILLPFVIIDMVVSAVLMSLGMMMTPPSLIALPIKILFFILIDGWNLLVNNLVKSFAV